MKRFETVEDHDISGLVLVERDCVNIKVKDEEPSSPIRYRVLTDAYRHNTSHGAKTISMGHFGRPKKEGLKSIAPLQALLAKESGFTVFEHNLHTTEMQDGVGDDIVRLVADFKASDTDVLLLPHTRTYRPEEDKDKQSEGRLALARTWASFGDIYVYAAMPDWQDHASTGGTIDAFLAAGKPVCAGVSCASEYQILDNMVTKPLRPFVAIVAGSKLSTKINSVINLYKKVDNLVLGGQISNAYLCAMYGIQLPGLTPEDITAARRLYDMDRGIGKILISSHLIKNDELGGVSRSAVISNRTIRNWSPNAHYILDADLRYSDDIATAVDGARQIFYNAVMGLDTVPAFRWGSVQLFSLVDRNQDADKYIGGGDTESNLRDLIPSVHKAAINGDSNYHLYYAGGTILEALGQKDVYEMPVAARLPMKEG